MKFRLNDENIQTKSFLSHGRTFGAGGGGMRKLVACKEDDCAARVEKLKQTLLKSKFQ